MQLLDESLPGVLLNRLQDHYASFLYPFVEAAWEGYFTARASSSFNESADEGYAQLLLSVLKRAQLDIPAARYNYRFDGDLDRLLNVALSRIHDVLRFSGMVLGHRGGLSRPTLGDQNLTDRLQEMGLLNWFVLFDSELSELWGRRGKWESFSEFLHLNCHVERLLWQFGLFPWVTDDGAIRVEVPLGTDAHRLAGVAPILRKVKTLVARGVRKHFAPLVRVVHRVLPQR